jgi:hypothetical protein
MKGRRIADDLKQDFCQLTSSVCSTVCRMRVSLKREKNLFGCDDPERQSLLADIASNRSYGRSIFRKAQRPKVVSEDGSGLFDVANQLRQRDAASPRPQPIFLSIIKSRYH